MGHKHNIEAGSASETPELKEEKANQDCNLDKFETPVYFTIFKFILNCSPFKSSEKVSDNYLEKQPNGKKVIYSQLRAPPRV